MGNQNSHKTMGVIIYSSHNLRDKGHQDWWIVVSGWHLHDECSIWRENELYCIQTVRAIKYLYHNYEIYPLSPLKPRSLVLIEQYPPNISDPVYSVHQSFMWFLWLNWRKSTFYPVTTPNDSKCWPIVTSSIQEPVASNCDVTMTDCSRVVAMDAFLAQWCWGQWFKEFVKDTSVPRFSTLWKNLWGSEMFGKWRHD